MLISLPVTFYYADDSAENEEIDIAPQHIVTVSRDPDNGSHSIVTDVYGDAWNVRLSRQQIRAKIKAYQKLNIMSLYQKGDS